MNENQLADLQRAERNAFQRMQILKHEYSEHPPAVVSAAEDEWLRLRELVIQARKQAATRATH